MSDDLYELLRSATVAVVNRAGDLRGSGFFIARGQVLTAAHVLDRFDGEDIFVRWGDTAAHPATIRWCDPSIRTPYIDIFPLPDLAVLHVSAATTTFHPCVMLSAKQPSDSGELVAQGYTAGLTTPEATPDPVRLRYDGPRSEPGGLLLKCNGNVVEDGMSGGPLLDLGSGQVVGVVKSKRSPDLPNGLYAVAASGLNEKRPDLWTENQLFHQTDRRWRLAIAPGSIVRNPTTAVHDLLEVTDATVRSRALSLPPSVDRVSLHQTIWVRHVSMVSSVPGEHQGSPSYPGSTGERFRWNPLRQVGTTTVVRGLPGYGKTWLLVHHAETIGRDSKAALAKQTDPDHVRIPLLLDCAALGARMPRDPDRDAVVKAITGLLRLDRLTVDAATDCTVMLREAYETGRLVICLDGLDEVPGNFRVSLKTALSIIASSSNPMLITTRPSALSLLDEVALEGRADIETLGFGIREASRFVRSWLSHRTERQEALETALQNSESLRAIATVPLLLSFLCRLGDMPGHTEQFPTSKTALYEKVIARLLSGSWREQTRGALDQDSPPDPERRLRILSDALGELQDSWRSSGVSIVRGDLSAALARQPDHKYVKAASAARWDAWQRVSNAEPAALPSDVVLWEYRFDGLLVDEEFNGLQYTVRVLHPSLRDFLLATYVKHMDDRALDDALARHRWFDPDWQEIFAIATPLLANPDAMITRILDVRSDPWFTQALFAAQCVAEAADRISTDVVETVIDRLLAATETSRLADASRGSAGVARMVRASVRPAVARGLAICAGDPAERPELYVEVACALAEQRDETGIGHALALLSERSTSRRHRQRLIAALATTEDVEAMKVVFELLSGNARIKELDAVLSSLKPQPGPLRDLAIRLLNVRTMTEDARVAVATALIECGGDALDAVRKAAGDMTLERGLRCQLYQQLINAGEHQLADEVMKLVRTPNLTAASKSYVVEAMLREGDAAWLNMALQLMMEMDIELPWSRRMALATAVRDMGATGVELLVQQIHSGLPLSYLLTPLVVLIEIRHRHVQRLAVDILRDEGVPAGIRGSVLLALLDSDVSMVDTAAAVSLSLERNLAVRDRMRVALALARAGIAEASNAIRTVLNDHADQAQWPLNSRLLATAGQVGRAVLIEVAKNEAYPWDIRTGSLIAVGTIQDPEVQRAISSIDLESIPDVWHNRLILGLTAAGSPLYVNRLVGSLPDFDGGYEALRQFMHGPSASPEIFATMQESLVATAKHAEDVVGLIGINNDLLESLGLTWSSENERVLLQQWLYEELEIRVGLRLSSLMLPSQLNEFEEFFDENDDDATASRWLSETFPEHKGFIRYEYELLKSDVIEGRIRPPGPPDPEPESSQILANLAAALGAVREWMRFSAAGQWSKFFDFAEANRSTLVNDFSRGLLSLAQGLDRGWPLHEAHLYILAAAKTIPIIRIAQLASSSNLLRDHLVDLLDKGDFWMLFLAGSWAEYRYPQSAHMVFYAALGAEGANIHRTALLLMEQSGKYASADQVEDGVRTIGERIAVVGWTNEVVVELQNALRAGHSKRSGS